MEPWLINENIFQHPFTCILSGPTQSGKTYLLYRILLNLEKVMAQSIDQIIYCYSLWQPLYNCIKKNKPEIQFFKGIFPINQLDQNKKKLIILDDLMAETIDNKEILNLYTRDSHHKNLSVFLINQNFFSKAKYTRSISLNSHYIILFKNPRDQTQIYTIARQMYPNKSSFIIEAFKDATSTPHGYLFLDLKQDTETRNRVQTGIIPGDLRIIYTD